MRFSFLYIFNLVILATGVVLVIVDAVTADADKPNIVMIYVDNMGYGDDRTIVPESRGT